MLKAAYRFFANDAIEPPDLLLNHIEATYGRQRCLRLRLLMSAYTGESYSTMCSVAKPLYTVPLR
jgi:hypothetical protein